MVITGILVLSRCTHVVFVSKLSLTGYLAAQMFIQSGLGNSEQTWTPAVSTSPPGGNLVDGVPPAARFAARAK